MLRLPFYFNLAAIKPVHTDVLGKIKNYWNRSPHNFFIFSINLLSAGLL